MNSKKLFADLVQRITLPESDDEIRQLVSMLIEHVLELSTSQVFSEVEIELTPELEIQIADCVKRLNNHEPIQYIIGKADFLGSTFLVSPSVLIPRPETEELAELIRQYPISTALDIGTGSGCLAISLKLDKPKADVYATDISDEALQVAIQNSERLGASIEFLKHDILTEVIPVTELDVIVSNPPYITLQEKDKMKPNVLDYEPHLALFVQHTDPLVFYRAIADKSRSALTPGGRVVVEINEHLGKAVADVFANAGYYNVSVVKDINGKDRIVSAHYV